MSDAFKPTMSLLCKLGSIIVHAEEASEPGGHPFDSMTVGHLLQDPEVAAWMVEMRSKAMLPVKRSEPARKSKRRA